MHRSLIARLLQRWYRHRYFRFDDGNGGVKAHWHYPTYELVGLDGRVQPVRACRHCLAHELIESYLWGWTGYVRRIPLSRRDSCSSRDTIYGRGPYPLSAVWGARAPVSIQEALQELYG